LIVFRRTLAFILSAVVIFTAFGLQAVSARGAGDAQTVEQVRAQVARLGVGEKARVEVKLRDNTQLKGYVSTAGADSFTVADAKTGAQKTVTYADVAQVKKPAGGLSPLTWGIIGGAAAAALIVGVTVVKPVLCDGGAGC
jgi:hypothetical protein